jgi:hypothetical protein
MIKIEICEIPTHKQFNNLLTIPPTKINRLTIIGFAGRTTNKTIRYYWLCECECGNEKVILDYNITKGHTKSCGCLHNSPTHCFTHKMTQTPEYSAWKGIKRRCYNQKFKHYNNYGGRGILVCDRWLECFENFYEDMGDRPSKEYSIERRDNDGNYCPENCYWATKKEQSNNKRSNRFIEFNNERLTVDQFSEKYQINNWIVRKRLNKGWDIQKIIYTPVRNYNKTIKDCSKE